LGIVNSLFSAFCINLIVIYVSPKPNLFVQIKVWLNPFKKGIYVSIGMQETKKHVNQVYHFYARAA